MLLLVMTLSVSAGAQSPCTNCLIKVESIGNQIKVTEIQTQREFYYTEAISSDCVQGLSVLSNARDERTILAKRTSPRLSGAQLCALINTALSYSGGGGGGGTTTVPNPIGVVTSGADKVAIEIPPDEKIKVETEPTDTLNVRARIINAPVSSVTVGRSNMDREITTTVYGFDEDLYEYIYIYNSGTTTVNIDVNGSGSRPFRAGEFYEFRAYYNIEKNTYYYNSTINLDATGGECIVSTTLK